MGGNNRMVLETADVRVREMFLAAGEEVPWHIHTEVVDSIYGLSGEIQVEMQDPPEVQVVKVGEGCQVAIGRPHRVKVVGEKACYLLIQGIGQYDFLPLEDQ